MTFTWRTHEGRDLRPDQMDTLHLFYTIKLLWNHTVPDKHQIRPFREWVFTLDADEREEAMKEMLAEMGRRLDKSALTPEQQAELVTIRLKDKVWIKALAALSLPSCDAGYGEDEEDTYYGLDQWDLFS